MNDEGSHQVPDRRDGSEPSDILYVLESEMDPGWLSIRRLIVDASTKCTVISSASWSQYLLLRVPELVRGTEMGPKV